MDITQYNIWIQYEYILYNHSNSAISSDTSALAMVVYHHISKNTWNCTPGITKKPEIAVLRRLSSKMTWLADPIPGRNMGICPIARQWLWVATNIHRNQVPSRDSWAAFPDFQHASALNQDGCFQHTRNLHPWRLWPYGTHPDISFPWFHGTWMMTPGMLPM